MRFLPKVIIICSRKKAGFDCKNYHKRGKLDNFWLDIISKINYKTLVVMSYTSLGLGSKKI